MASLEHQIRTPRDNLDHTGQPPSAQATPVVSTESEQKPDQLIRLAFTVWIIAFAFLGTLALWDLIKAILFR